jgi:3-hydroxyisobutyrate dehydrogenase-like beta-hydroxyacid dehydrogenase
MPLLHKAFDLGLAAGDQLGVPLPIASATRQIIAQEVGEGNTDADFATLLLRVARGAGLDIQSENQQVDDGLQVQE